LAASAEVTGNPIYQGVVDARDRWYAVPE